MALHRAFDQIDANKDGVITRAEFVAAVERDPTGFLSGGVAGNLLNGSLYSATTPATTGAGLGGAGMEGLGLGTGATRLYKGTSSNFSRGNGMTAGGALSGMIGAIGSSKPEATAAGFSAGLVGSGQEGLNMGGLSGRTGSSGIDTLTNLSNSTLGSSGTSSAVGMRHSNYESPSGLSLGLGGFGGNIGLPAGLGLAGLNGLGLSSLGYRAGSPPPFRAGSPPPFRATSPPFREVSPPRMFHPAGTTIGQSGVPGLLTGGNPIIDHELLNPPPLMNVPQPMMNMPGSLLGENLGRLNPAAGFNAEMMMDRKVNEAFGALQANIRQLESHRDSLAGQMQTLQMHAMAVNSADVHEKAVLEQKMGDMQAAFQQERDRVLQLMKLQGEQNVANEASLGAMGSDNTLQDTQASQLEEEVERMKTALSKAVEIGRQLSAEETQLRADAEEVEHKLQRDTDAARAKIELLDRKHAELEAELLALEGTNQGLQNELDAEEANKIDMIANERKASELLGSVLSLNEKLVKQIQHQIRDRHKQPWIPPSFSPTRRDPKSAVAKRKSGKKTRPRRKTEPSMRFLDATVTSGNRAKGHKPQALNRLDREAVEKAKREADQMDDSLQRLTNEFHKLKAAAKVSGLISPGSPKSPHQADFEASLGVVDLAEEIMRTADGLSRNGVLSVSELGTFLKGTPHEDFRKWMLNNRQRRFKKFDKNKDGAITIDELRRAVAAYQTENFIG